MSVAMPRTRATPRAGSCSSTVPRRRCAPTSCGRSRPSSTSGSRSTGSRSRPCPARCARELSWTGAAGTGAELASALRGWDGLRYEVTEDPTARLRRVAMVLHAEPGHPPHHDAASGDAVIHEDRLRDAMLRSRGDAEALQDEIDLLLGVPWDDELEPFRYAGDGAPVRWLHKVG